MTEITTRCKVAVEPCEGGYRWSCPCGQSANGFEDEGGAQACGLFHVVEDYFVFTPEGAMDIAAYYYEPLAKVIDLGRIVPPRP